MKKHPILKVVADYCFDKISHLVISLVVGVAVVAYQKHDNKNLKSEIHSDTGYLGTNWVGHAMSDAHNEIYANVDAITTLSNRLVTLESSKKP